MVKLCSECGKIIKLKPSRYNKIHTCSKECRTIRRKRTSLGSNNNNWKNAGLYNCKYCGTEFKAYNKKRKYCSFKCSCEDSIGRHIVISDEARAKISLAVNKRWANYENKKYFCACGNEMNRRNNTCSECRLSIKEESKKKNNKCCSVCGNEFNGYDGYKTCSANCARIHRTNITNGKNNPNWKGGIKLPNQRGRYTVPYYEWIRNVFERDNYTCQHCGQVGGKLNAHHIKKWAKHKELRLDVDNGLTLCISCHKLEHAKSI